MRFIGSTILAFLVFTFSTDPAARAQEREWYGWQIVLTDAMSIGLVASGRTVSAWIGLAGYALGGPLIHVAHGDYPEAVVDLGARVVLPIGLTFLGAEAQGRCNDCEGIGGGPILGFLAGTIAAMSIDYVFLSTHKQVVVTPTHGGVVLSLSSRF